MTQLTTDIAITRICGLRDASLAKAREAADLYVQAIAAANEARALARDASAGAGFYVVDRSQSSAYGSLFHDLDRDRALAAFQAHTDACIWTHVSERCGLDRLMDATARESFRRDLAGANVPEVTEANITATLEALQTDAKLIFQRGLARAFGSLDRRFRSHDAFRFEDRVVFTYVFDGYGSINHNSPAFDRIADVERVLAVLDGQEPDAGALRKVVCDSRQGWGPRQGVCETPYFRLRSFKNGNAHLWFTRKDLVAKANQVLADYYGAVLPDAVGTEVERPISGELARSLQFYRSPRPVVATLLRELHLMPGARVLEPSAGDGAIVREVERLQPTARVTAIEVDAGRAAQLRALGRQVDVQPANFLRVPPSADYDFVLMNPPFSGTHWMDHVKHAHAFLAPHGVLRAVLPATAEVGTSAKHEAFREWAAKRSRYGRLRFTELPSESVAESGTRVETVILELVGWS